MAGIQIDGVNNKIDFDDDADTSISSNTDDTLVIESGGVNIASITAGEFAINEGSADIDFRVESNGNTHMLFVDGGNNRVGMITTPDLGIGLHIRESDSGGSIDAWADALVIEGSADSGMTILSGNTSDGSINWGDDGDNDAGRIVYNHNQNSLKFYNGGAERVSIASTGNVSIGGTSSAGLFNLYTISHALNAMVHTNSSDTGTIHNLRCINASGTLVGGITNDGSNTAFATSSDYRLKENVDYTWDATTRLKQLKPARFNWIADDTNTLMDGFIAHEVSSIVPEAVRGAKDATITETDDNGDEQTIIEPQGIDQSKLVPLLVKTVQELETRIAALEG